MNYFKKITLVLLCAVFAGQALAEKSPRDGRIDPRVKTLEYHEGQVYVIHTHFLQSSMIMFGNDY